MDGLPRFLAVAACLVIGLNAQTQYSEHLCLQINNQCYQNVGGVCPPNTRMHMIYSNGPPAIPIVINIDEPLSLEDAEAYCQDPNEICCLPDVPGDDCFGIACGVNGICNPDTQQCDCFPGFAPPSCVNDVCDGVDCNLGFCEPTGVFPPGYICNCSGTDRTGPACDVNACLTPPHECDAEGTQMNGCIPRDTPIPTNPLQFYSCDCVTGFSGDTCQVDVCTLNPPCLNGATCERDSATARTCNCATGYSGDQCENFVCTGECGSGTCTPIDANNFVCSCAAGFDPATECVDKLDVQCGIENNPGRFLNGQPVDAFSAPWSVLISSKINTGRVGSATNIKSNTWPYLSGSILITTLETGTICVEDGCEATLSDGVTIIDVVGVTCSNEAVASAAVQAAFIAIPGLGFDPEIEARKGICILVLATQIDSNTPYGHPLCSEDTLNLPTGVEIFPQFCRSVGPATNASTRNPLTLFDRAEVSLNAVDDLCNCLVLRNRQGQSISEVVRCALSCVGTPSVCQHVSGAPYECLASDGLWYFIGLMSTETPFGDVTDETYCDTGVYLYHIYEPFRDWVEAFFQQIHDGAV